MDEHDMQQFRSIIELLQKVDPWGQRISPETQPETVDEHSSLAGDDRITDPYQTSHVVWHSISHAVDHLNMLRTVLGQTGVIHMYAPFSVARAAIENAITAVWLLAPPNRRERVGRRCRFAAGDFRGGDAAADLVVQPGKPRKSLSEHLDRLRQIAQRGGIDEAEAVKKAPYVEIIRDAGPSAEAARIGEFVWRMCSAIAHGDLWPTVSIASKVEVQVPGAPDGTLHVNVAANMQALHLATFVAVTSTDRAWQLYDQRRRYL